MAQAPLKKSSSSSSSSSSTKSSIKTTNAASKITRKGSRTIAPKNAKLAKQQKMTKKLSAGLIRETERMLGARAGHLEMLGPGGKKGAKESGKGKGAADGRKMKGGSKGKGR